MHLFQIDMNSIQKYTRLRVGKKQHGAVQVDVDGTVTQHKPSNAGIQI